MLFFQNSVGVNAEAVITPAPLHAPDGRTISACYTRPMLMGAELEAELGPFPLHNYWGPGAGAESSRWIVEATRRVLERGPLQLVLTYLPHLDYDLQRFGPDSPQAGDALAQIAALLEELAGVCERHGYLMVVVGDYAIEPAEGFALPNLALREEGLLGIRRVGDYELPDMGSSLLFAVVDHQVAHVYCQSDYCPQAAVDALDGLAGVGRILDGEAQKELGIDHARAGDLVLEAAPGHWFAYDWWTDEENAPPYARTVDIHNKPGYDPLELFLAPDRKGTARDGNLVKGTHGRAGGGTAAMIVPPKAQAPERLLAATEVCALLCDLAGG
jgi:predicted AlkP superfamily pyrophosphatase or phosphodiesterase